MIEKDNDTVLIARIPVEVMDADPDKGLSEEQVNERTRKGWINGMPPTAAATEKEIVLRNCITFFNLVFIVLAVILALAGSSVKNMTFLGVVLCNTVIGIVQEIRAKRAVDALTLVAAQNIRAIRGSEAVNVRSDQLVRDDIVEFRTGDQICADAIIRRGQVQVNESLITGEADPIIKNAGDALHSGSFVVAGKARAQLTRVGEDAYAAKLSLEAKANPGAAKSGMMRSLDRLIRVVGIALIPVGALLFWQEYKILQLGLRDSVEGMVAALVGMIPEGLYLLTSIAMAASALKLSKERVLVQDMNCIETLARVDVLCVDKTGTITEPVMEVEDIISLTQDPPEYLEEILAAFYYGEEPENDTAQAMAQVFAKENDWECLSRIPFTSITKWAAAVFRDRGAFLVGAPEFILADRFAEVEPYVNEWTAKGYRVLLAAKYDGEPDPGSLDRTLLTPLALVLLTNRVRAEVQETFRYFEHQGVSIRVISGDNPVTVSDVARRAGIRDAERYIDAGLLETDEELLQAVDEYVIFGRVTPEKKKRLIQAFKQRGHTVAMTGDGVNDILAMKESDCSVAMASGAQAASQVAKLVLLNSDFGAMPGVVAEGRRVINNIQRAATLFLVKNIFSLGLSVISLFTNLPYPLIPIHLTMISSLTIGVPSFFLAMEPNYERVTGRFLRNVLRRALPGGLTNIFVVLAAQAFMVVFGLGEAETSTICAAILSFVGLLVLLETCKPFDKFRKLIWGAMAAALVLCFTVLGGFLELQAGSVQTKLVMATLLIMTPTVFFAVQRLCDWGDKLIGWLKQKWQDRKAA